MKKPNIIIFNPDQFRYDAMGHMCNPAAVTPNFDNLVKKDAVSFRNAYCQSPLCGPSRCSFMTGLYPHVRGHRIQNYLLRENEPMLLKTLKENGYFVWWGGKNDLIPGQKSFDSYCNYKNKPQNKSEVKPMFGECQTRRGDKNSDNYYSFYYGKIDKEDTEVYYDSDWDNIYSAVNFIKNYTYNEPVCVYLPLVYPHPPYSVEDPWYSLIDRNKIPERIPSIEDLTDRPSKIKGLYEMQKMQEWSEERWNELRATYYAMCSRVDYQFGLIIDALKEANMYDDSAIFVFSDHGDFTGDYGLPEKSSNIFQDCLIRVPFIIKPPSWINGKSGVHDAMVELIDFYATVEDMTGIPKTHAHFGKSLTDVICGKNDFHRDAVFSEGGILNGESHCTESKGYDTAIPPGENKTLQDSLYWPYFKLNNCDGVENTKAIMIRTNQYKYVMRLYETDEFYILSEDPQEMDNRISDSSYQQVIEKLKYRILEHLLETGDIVPFDLDERFEPEVDT